MKMTEPYINHAQRRFRQNEQKRMNKLLGTLLAENLELPIASHASQNGLKCVLFIALAWPSWICTVHLLKFLPVLSNAGKCFSLLNKGTC